MAAPKETCNTSFLARMYRVHTKDIERKLDRLGITPYKTVITQAQKRYMYWDKAVVLDALENYQARLAEQKAQEEELIKQRKGKAITEQDSLEAAEPTGGALSDFGTLEDSEKAKTSVDQTAILLQMAEDMRKMREHINRLEKQLTKKT